MVRIFSLMFCFKAQILFAQVPKLMLPIGHTEIIGFADLSPDGKKVVTASWDHTAKIWDAQTGKLLADLKEHTGEVNSAVFSTDGNKIVTASKDNTAKIWDAKTGKLLLDLKNHWSEVNYATFNPNATKIITTSSSSAFIWDVTNGRLILEIKWGSAKEKIYENLSFAHFSPDGKKIIGTLLHQNLVRVWDAETGKLLVELKGHKSYIKTAVFSSDCKKIVTASVDKTAKVWNAETGKMLINLNEHQDMVISAVFSSDGESVITETYNGVMNEWDAATGKLLFASKKIENGGTKTVFSADRKKYLTTDAWSIIIGDAEQKRPSTKIKLYGSIQPVYAAEFRPAMANAPEGSGQIVTAHDDFAVIWDFQTGVPYSYLRGHNRRIASAVYSRDGNKIVTGSSDTTARIWDVQTGKQLAFLKLHHNVITSAVFSPDAQKILTVSKDETAMIWDAITGEPLARFQWQIPFAHPSVFSPDGKKLISSWNDVARIRNTATGEIVIDKPHSRDPVHINMAVFSPVCEDDSIGGKKFVTALTDGTAQIWDAETGQLLKVLKGHEQDVESAEFSPDGKKIVTASQDGTVKIWDVVSGNLLLDLKGHTSSVHTAYFSPDGKKVVTVGTSDRTIKIWDAASGKLLVSLDGHDNLIYSASLKADGEKLVSASADYTTKVWDTKSGRQLYTFFTVDSSDYFLLTPEGYYRTTQNTGKLLYYVSKDLKVITFEQLDVKYNRPDKVLESIGNSDTAMINSYKRAYYKRIKKLGIDTTQFNDGYSVPEADFENRNQIEYDTNNEVLRLRIKGFDTTFALDHFNIWINEVPLFGLKGINIQNRKVNTFDTTISVSLSQGDNRIETSVTNVNGTESYRMPLYVKYTATQPVKEKVYFIGIGINQFADKRRNLQWCVKDIRDLALRFKEKYENDIVIDTLFDRNVTLKNVQDIKQKLLKTNINDKVIIAYSGHGLLSKQYDYYLSSYAVNFKNPEENGIAYEEFENLLDNIPARKKLLLLDACHSGEVDKDEMLAIQNSKNKIGYKGLFMNRGSVDEGGNETKTKTVGLQNSFELMQSLFVNVGKGTGATIISAAGGVQFALERDDLENGVFTFSLLEALEQHKTIKVSRLKKIVVERVEQLTNGLQKPVARNELKDFDWEVW